MGAGPSSTCRFEPPARASAQSAALASPATKSAAAKATSNGNPKPDSPLVAKKSATTVIAVGAAQTSPNAARGAQRKSPETPNLDFTPVGGVPPGCMGTTKQDSSLPKDGLGPRSMAALDALTKELALFEERKRAVELLARKLEPESDEEEDEDNDGFPLR